MNAPIVIAVAAPVGGGKSTLAHALAHALGNATTLHFDDYEDATARPPDELVAWLRDGGDCSRFVPAQLLQDLTQLKSGLPVRQGRTGNMLIPSPYIVFEMPLGREHAQTSALIDMLIWIETPLDIALARNLHDMASNVRAGPPEQARPFVTWLDQYLDNYLRVLRPVFEWQRQRVGAKADLALDGQLPTPEMAAITLAEIARRFPGA